MEQQYKYDKDKLKDSLEIDQIFDLAAELGGEPRMAGPEMIVCRTICHCGNSHKLYYYNNTKLFRCYTECSPEIFDIYELVRKVKSQNQDDYTLPAAIDYVAQYFGFIAENVDFVNSQEKLHDWEILNKYNKINSISDNKQTVELKIYNKDILQHYPRPHIIPWEKEDIKHSVIINKGVCYNPVDHGILIPHYDINDNLVGVRIRTLVKEDEIYGKYRPAVLNGKMYNHPLGFNLYNLNFSKENIKRMQKVVVFEGEKSCLKFASYFGEDCDISVAVCGSSLINYQVDLLLSLGVKEIIIAFDKQFQKSGDEEFKRWTKKLTDINKKYSPKVQISFMFDKWDLLEYKMSPIDAGKEIFLELFKKRIIL